MSVLAEAAGAGGIGTLLPLRQVTLFDRTRAGWFLHHQDAAAVRPGTVGAGGERVGPFDRIVLALPAPQAAPLLAALGPGFASAVAQVVIDPGWVMMLGYAERHGGADERSLDGPLCWIGRDSSRPGRAVLPECWVAHGGAAWSAGQLEREPDAVLAELHAAFVAATGIVATPIYRAAHRWRHARTRSPLGQPCLADAAAGLVVCGDWCLGAGVEAAFDSGRAAAAACAG